ncbi:MAG: competence protein TfoX [Robiginitomaculum sp.]|nr:MAG: competence protein TfoX [Robiginitomaculum sp.]
MAADTGFVEHIMDQIHDECEMSFKHMFGAVTLYSKGKVVGLVGDGKLFVKPTEAGKVYIGDFIEAPAYTGARPSLLIEDKIEDGEWLSQLISITEKALPKPKPRTKPRAKKKPKPK